MGRIAGDQPGRIPRLPLFMPGLCGRRLSVWPAYARPRSDQHLIEQRERGMADVIYLALGGGVFLALAALAVLLKRVGQ